MNYERLVEGKSIIAETRTMVVTKATEIDIYEQEKTYWAKSVISDELGWNEDDDD